LATNDMAFEAPAVAASIKFTSVLSRNGHANYTVLQFTRAMLNSVPINESGMTQLVVSVVYP